MPDQLLRHASALPRLLRVQVDRVTCGSCFRRWRLPPDGMLSAANFDFLCEHALAHRPVHRRPLPIWLHTEKPPTDAGA